MVNLVLEIAGFLLVVLALGLVYVPLAIGVAGAGLILIANRPERAEQGSADARTPTLP